MPTYISLADAAFQGVDLQRWLIGGFVSTIAYGIVIALVLAYLHAFLQQPPEPTKELSSSRARRRMEIVVMIYTFLMFSFSTVAYIGETWGTLEMIFPSSAQGVDKKIISLARYSEAVCLVLASWFADALTFWRCTKLYQTTSKANRVVLYIWIAVVSVMSMGTGLAYIATGFTLINYFMVAHAVAEAITNTSITALIASRIRYRQKNVESALGAKYTTAYSSLVRLFIESAVLIVVFNVVHVILVKWPNHMLIIPHQFLVHINVISALLILYRISYSLPSNPTAPESISLDLELPLQLRRQQAPLNMSDGLTVKVEGQTVRDYSEEEESIRK